MQEEKNSIKNYSDIESVNNNFNNFIIERAFSLKTTFINDDDFKNTDFDYKLTNEEIAADSHKQTITSIGIYKRGFLDAILLFFK